MERKKRKRVRIRKIKESSKGDRVREDDVRVR
jgi:hypothetical protein